jgi:hypothetical protein
MSNPVIGCTSLTEILAYFPSTPRNRSQSIAAAQPDVFAIAPASDWHGSDMSAIEQIHRMPLHEKLLAMEAIWEDICREDDRLEVPQWHKDTLDERERLIAEGKAQFMDWEEAKQQIKKAAH